VAPGHQIGYFVGQNACLAASGARQHQGGSLAVKYRFPLRGVQ
jgi:hypothetical protein